MVEVLYFALRRSQEDRNRNGVNDGLNVEFLLMPDRCSVAEILHVHADAAPPFKQPSVAEYWAALNTEASMDAIETAHAHVDLPRPFGRRHGPPAIERVRQVVRVNDSPPLAAADLVPAETGKLRPLPIDEVDVSVGRCDPNQSGKR